MFEFYKWVFMLDWILSLHFEAAKWEVKFITAYKTCVLDSVQASLGLYQHELNLLQKKRKI